MQEMAPRELDHPTAHPGIAGFSQSALASSPAALIRSSGQTGIPRQRFAIPQLAREHLLHQHIGTLHANPDNARQQVDHRGAALSRCCLQPLRAGRGQVLAATIPVLLVLAIMPGPVLRIFGAEFVQGETALRILIVGMIVPVMVGWIPQK